MLLSMLAMLLSAGLGLASVQIVRIGLGHGDNARSSTACSGLEAHSCSSSASASPMSSVGTAREGRSASSARPRATSPAGSPTTDIGSSVSSMSTAAIHRSWSRNASLWLHLQLRQQDCSADRRHLHHTHAGTLCARLESPAELTLGRLLQSSTSGRLHDSQETSRPSRRSAADDRPPGSRRQCTDPRSTRHGGVAECDRVRDRSRRAAGRRQRHRRLDCHRFRPWR